MVEPLTAIDKQAARRAFNAAAASYDAAAALQREIGNRMLERLEYIRLAPERVLDLGTGTGHALPALAARYPQAQLLALDLAEDMLHRIPSPGRLARWMGRGVPVGRICADAEHLPLAAASVDLMVSNVALQWVNDPDATFAGLLRALRPGGLLMFTSFGPDTLTELRQSWATVDDEPHVHAFIDMHDLGDALLRAGFAEPVMDCERITMTYDSVNTLVADLKAIGAHNAASDRRHGLTSVGDWKKMLAAYEQFRQPDGLFPASWEVVYGHAWAPETGVRVAVPAL